MYKLTIKIPVYNCTCSVIIDKNICTTINKYVKKNKWGDDMLCKKGEELHGLAVSPENLKDYYIFYETSSLTINYIAHEIAHMVDYILSERGIELIGETRAYTTGFLTEKIVDFVLGKKLLINKWLPEHQKEEEQKVTKKKKEEHVSNQSQDSTILNS